MVSQTGHALLAMPSRSYSYFDFRAAFGFGFLALSGILVSLPQSSLPDSLSEAGALSSAPPESSLVPVLRAAHCFSIITFADCPRTSLSA